MWWRIGPDPSGAGGRGGPDRGPFDVKAVPWGRGLLPVLILLFVMIRLAEARGSAPGWVSSYGDDLLCLPLVLSVVLTAQRLSLRSGRFTLPGSHGLLAVVLFGVLFEGILPVTGARAVADPLDILMYLAGFLVFQAGLNQPTWRYHGNV